MGKEVLRAPLAGWIFVVFFVAGNVHASETYPPILAEELDMPCVPNCLPCHKEPVGNALNLRDNGIRIALLEFTPKLDTDELMRAALRAFLMQPPDLDTDGDGTQDVVELGRGENPYGGKNLCDGPRYGCFASHVAPALPTRIGALALAFCVAGALWLRRR